MNAKYLLEIPKRNQTCSKGAEALVPGATFFSTLQEDEKENYIRKDYCVSCWQAFQSELIDGVKTFWKSKFPTKKEKRHFENRFEQAFALLQETVSSTVEEEQMEAFVLALFLSRKKHLLLREEIVLDGNKYYMYEVAATEQTLPIKFFPLNSIQIDKIQANLSKKFN